MDKLFVKDIKDLKPILNNINWSFYPKPPVFENVIQPFNSRKYHWYPATYIPEIPYSLIEVLTEKNAKVFDPFMGIGTTFFQSLILGRIPISNDVSKISYHFVNGLFKLFNPQINLNLVRKEIESEILLYNLNENYSDLILSDTQYLEELKKWFTPENFNVICFLIIKKDFHEDEIKKSIYNLIVSSLLNSSSNQDRGMSCIADNMLPKIYQIRDVDVYRTFRSSLKRLLTDVENTKKILSEEFNSKYKEFENQTLIFNDDISEKCIIEDESIDIVISSPPYPNMIDYTTSQRLAHYYYGFDLNEEKKFEIGARYRRNAKNTLLDYFNKMNKANCNIVKTLKKGGLLCYIMPSFNSDNEKNIERKKIIQKVMANLEEELNMMKEIEIERTVPSLRRTHNSKWTTLEKEIIYIYRKM